MLSGVSARSRDAPAIMREQRTPRAWLLPGVSGLCLAGTVTALRPVLRDAGLGGVAASLATAAAAGIALATLVVLVRWGASQLWTDTAPPDSRAVAAGLATSVGVGLVLPAAAWLGVPPPLAVVAALRRGGGHLPRDARPGDRRTRLARRRGPRALPPGAGRGVRRGAPGRARRPVDGRPRRRPGRACERHGDARAAYGPAGVAARSAPRAPAQPARRARGLGDQRRARRRPADHRRRGRERPRGAARGGGRPRRRGDRCRFDGAARGADHAPLGARRGPARAARHRRGRRRRAACSCVCRTRRSTSFSAPSSSPVAGRAFAPSARSSSPPRSWNRPSGDGIDGAIRACRRSLRRLRLAMATEPGGLVGERMPDARRAARRARATQRRASGQRRPRRGRADLRAASRARAAIRIWRWCGCRSSTRSSTPMRR